MLGNVGIPGQAHPKLCCQLIENLENCRKRVYLQAKKQLHHQCFSDDVAKISILILGTFGKPGYTYPK